MCCVNLIIYATYVRFLQSSARWKKAVQQINLKIPSSRFWACRTSELGAPASLSGLLCLSAVLVDPTRHPSTPPTTTKERKLGRRDQRDSCPTTQLLASCPPRWVDGASSALWNASCPNHSLHPRPLPLHCRFRPWASAAAGRVDDLLKDIQAATRLRQSRWLSVHCVEVVPLPPVPHHLTGRGCDGRLGQDHEARLSVNRRPVEMCSLCLRQLFQTQTTNYCVEPVQRKGAISTCSCLRWSLGRP